MTESRTVWQIASDEMEKHETELDESCDFAVVHLARRAFALDKSSPARIRFSRTYPTKGAKGETSP
jgi:hypothetical protein